ncbi:MAG: ferrous iron transport protein B [Anaerolineales bacterium]|nr:ferrous iron transport protein B [Anaerolineales bacterium]
MRFALIGQPNCGKSTLFNQVSGYKAETGNFAGTTLTFTESKVRVLSEIVDLVDLPGTYSLAGSNPAEREVLHYLAYHPIDVVINIIDASHLAQGLNLTLELMELGRPLIVALNMMDEAARLGMEIDGPKLEELLGVDVLPLIASRGRGVRAVFTTAMHVAREALPPNRPVYSPGLEDAIGSITNNLNGQAQASPLASELMAIKLLEGNAQLLERVEGHSPKARPLVEQAQKDILERQGQPAIWVFNAERHEKAAQLAEQVVIRGEKRRSKRDYLDDILLHRFWGYVALAAILWLFFQIVYSVGSALEAPLLESFDNLAVWLAGLVGPGTFGAEMLTGVIQGIAGGVAIVLPYLLPFLLGLSILEDIGYLPRLAFLVDALMSRLGLHGKAIVPFILGYGCNVPAVMSTRLLEERRDRFIAATMATLVPCAARLAVVFGLVAFYLGPQLALGIYLFNLLVIALTGHVLSRFLPESSPGLILEIPVYRLPTWRAVAHKSWFRIREFVVDAWPLLIFGSVMLAVFERLDLARWLNAAVRPLTWVLDLPSRVGVPLIFGIFRKELSLVMLRQALGVVDFAEALTPIQMVTFTVFVVFYIPCLATLAALRRELGTRDMLIISLITVAIALAAALLARAVATVFI